MMLGWLLIDCFTVYNYVIIDIKCIFSGYTVFNAVFVCLCVFSGIYGLNVRKLAILAPNDSK